MTFDAIILGAGAAGLFCAAQAGQRGKRVLVAEDCFPSMHFLLAGLAPKMGFTLDTVPKRDGASWVEPDDFMEQWGQDVGLALLTWVTSTATTR